MKKQHIIYLLFLFVFLSYCDALASAGKKHQNFLFIGNSFTMRHDLPKLFADISNEGNGETFVETEIIGYGGRSLFHHWECFRSYNRLVINKLSRSDFENTIEELNKLYTYDNVPDFYSNYWKELGQNSFYRKYSKKTNITWKSERMLFKSAISKHNLWYKNKKSATGIFDYVVLQSWLDVGDNDEIGYLKYSKLFAEIANANGIKPILYLTAPYSQNQEPVSNALGKEQALAECKIAQQFAKKNEVIVVPVPLAIILAQESTEPIARTLTFRYKNDFHPNNTMAYLTACTFYAAIYGKSPEGILLNTVRENKMQNIHGEPITQNQSKSGMETHFNPDGGALETVFTDEERLFLQRIAWKAVKNFQSENY